MRKTTLLFCFLMLAALCVWGQSNGTLSGKVTSAQGTGVPNAAVTVTNVDTNTSQKVLTGPDGSFSVAGLTPGNYRVDIESSGYKRTSQQNVMLSTNTPTSISVVLQAGSMNETVEIRGHAPQVDDQGGDISTGLGIRMIRELPVIDRNHQELVGLPSGTTPPQPALDVVRDPERNRYFSTNGQSPLANEWQLDGVSNTEYFRNTAIRVVPVESLQMMHIESANQRAEHGFNGGSFVNDITPSGTNGVHGSLFEFYSGNLLRARNYFNNASNPNPRFVYNQFGGTIGAPIVKDRTFFYGSYEGTYQNGGLTEVTTVPVGGALTGNFSGIPGLTIYNPQSGNANTGFGRTPFSNGSIGSTLINPFARAIASYIPAPNQAGFINNYVTNVPFKRDGNKFDAKLDQHFTDRTMLFLRYGYTNYWNTEASPLGSVIGSATRGRLLGQNAVFSLQHDFGGSLITDWRMGFNRYDQKLNSATDQTVLARQLGLTNFNNNMIGINIAGFAGIGAPPYVPEHGVDNNFNWVWDWSLHTSMNDLRWGVDIRRIRADGFTDTMFGSQFGPNGTAYFGPGTTMLASTGAATLSPYASLYNSWASFLLGAPSQVGVSNYFTTPTIRQTQGGLWLGDRVSIMRRLTLDLGVRYEVYTPLEPRNPGGAAFFNSSNNTFNFAGIDSTAMHYNLYDLDNVAPRVGLAARITDKTVLRGGYGINYFQLPYMYSGFMAPIYGSVSGVQGGFAAAPFQGTFSPVVSSTVAAPSSLQNGAAAGNLPATVVPRRIDTPYVQTFSLQLQQEFYWTTLLQVGYVGTRGRHLPGISELNAALPGSGVSGLPFFNQGRTASTLLYDNGLSDNYNSLQASLSKRFTGGVSFLASYTWSKALGYTANNGMILNPTNLRSNYGPLDYDRQHVLTISHIWELPFGMHGNHILGTILGGWQLNGIFTWATGTPLTVTADPLTCACPGNTVLASLLPGANPFATNGGTTYLNSAAFVAPAGGQFGNLGRGAIYGPDTKNYDASLFKNFHVHDRFNLQLRGEVYNLTNTPRFASPVTNINSPDFGQRVTTINGAFGRQVTVAARLLF